MARPVHNPLEFSHKSVNQLVMRSAVASMYPLTRGKQDSNGWWKDEVPAEREA